MKNPNRIRAFIRWLNPQSLLNRIRAFARTHSPITPLILEETMDAMTDGYLAFEERLLNLHDIGVTDNQARILVVKAAEYGVMPSCDILPVFHEYLEPRHNEFRERSMWSLLNAFTEIAHKFPAAKSDVFHRRLTRLFGLDGQPAMLS